MRTQVLLATAIMAVASPAFADPVSDIRAANTRWTEAIAKKDMATVETIVAPEFRLTSGEASAEEVTPRDRWMANLGKMQIASYSTEITDLEVHGDTALATVKGQWDVAFGDFKSKEGFQLLDLWVRSSSGWQVARRHITSKE